jgi:dTDP-4-dehydrorhamnose 3,5-epimerase
MEPSGPIDAGEVHELPPLPEGMRVRRLRSQGDARGSTHEIYDPSWELHDAPIVYAHAFTILPGKAKGWGRHRGHDDRYALLKGSIEIALYDARADSPTTGLTARIAITEDLRRMVTIPAGVWHATRNIGDCEAIVMDLPTVPYCHENPDKWTLPLDTRELLVDLGPDWVGH